MHQPICCERVEIWMGDYLERKLPQPDQQRLESHLAVCTECWTEVRKYRRTIACLAALPGEPAPLPVRQALLARVAQSLPAHR